MPSHATPEVRAFALKLPEIKPGDDIGELICENARILDGDIIVVCSTIVSKAEGRIVRLSDVDPSARAREIAERNGDDPRFVELVLRESEQILIDHPFILSVTRSGHVCPNAGIDRSNVEEGFALLHPRDADESARRIRERIEEISGKKVSVIISDTCGRAFRRGQTGTAIGCSALFPLRDWRGKKDLYGNVLRVKNEAIADEIAAFANLLCGEGDWGTPVAVIRGLNLRSDHEGVKELFRPREEDLIRDALEREKKA